MTSEAFASRFKRRSTPILACFAFSHSQELNRSRPARNLSFPLLFYMCKQLAKRCIFLMALLVTVILATPILHDPTDAVDAAASSLEMSPDGFHSTYSLPQDEDIVASDPATTQCPLDPSEHNVINNSVQKRHIFRRQNRACKADPNIPSRTPVQLRGPTMSIHRSSEGKIQKRPCPTRGPSQHVTCGYAMVGDSVAELDFALNCVPGNPPNLFFPTTGITKIQTPPQG